MKTTEYITMVVAMMTKATEYITMVVTMMMKTAKCMTMVVAMMMVGILFLTGCSGEYITREYTVRNELELREAFANAKNNEVVLIILDSDIQLQGDELQPPAGSTVIIDSPRGTSRSITRVYGNSRHFHIPPNSTLSIRGFITIQSQRSISDIATPTVNRGGISVNGGTLNISGDTNIRNNNWDNGGAISMAYNGTLNMSGNSKITENTSYANGGGIHVQGNSAFNMTGNSIINGNTTYGNGGGIFVAGNSSINISGTSRITENIASADGGGIFANGQGQGVRIVMSGNVRISENTAQRGGGIALLNGVQLTRTGNVSISNNAGDNEFIGNSDSKTPSDVPQTPQTQPSVPNQRQ